jgi:uncharacterized protein YjbI with pentapeptide repeats
VAPAGRRSTDREAPVAPDEPDLPEAPAAARPVGRLDGLVLEDGALSRTDFRGQAANDLRFDRCRLSAVALADVEAPRALLQDVLAVGGDWANLRVRDARLRRVSLSNLRLTGADFSGVSFEDVRLRDCRVDLASFRFTTLSRVVFDGCRLDEADFSGARLESVAFVGCSLVRSAWADATLQRCELRASDLSGAGNPERLRGLRMPWADVVAAAAELAKAAGISIVE